MSMDTKEKRKIVVNNDTFIYVLDESVDVHFERKEFAQLRCYGTNKSSYLEILFHWESMYYNLHRPKAVSLFIKYAIENGWNYKEDKQIYRISAEDSKNIIKELGIDLL